MGLFLFKPLVSQERKGTYLDDVPNLAGVVYHKFTALDETPLRT